MSHRAKKSLGQHFLTSRKALVKIIECAEIKKGERVLEIGPGKGVLTEALLKAGAQVLAIEKDEELANFLSEKFEKEISDDQLEIISGDALSFSPLQFCQGQGNALTQGSQGQGNTLTKLEEYKIAANIPYYITGQFFRKFLSEEHQPKLIVALIQKEVAERIIAKNGKEGLLSISVKVYGRPRLEKVVPASSFLPPPKVDSAIISIKNISRDFFVDLDEEKFFKLVKSGFSKKRKQLKNNLGADSQTLVDCGLSPVIRAEVLTIDQWKCLVKNLEE